MRKTTTTNIKKVGVPTTLIRNAIKNENGLKVINATLNGVNVTLTQDPNKTYYFGSLQLEGITSVCYNGKYVIKNDNTDNILWINNKSMVTKFLKGDIDKLELNGLLIDRSGTYISKDIYEFYSNENDYTLEEI